jgi:hypothetical protein
MDLLGVLRQLLSQFTGFAARTSPQLASIALTILTLADQIIDGVTGVADRIRNEIIAALRVSIQGPDPEVSATLPEIHDDTQQIISVVGAEPGILGNILALCDLLAFSVQVAQNGSYSALVGEPQTCRASGFYSLPLADGLAMEVLSVPASQGAEFAGSFLRYPHLGWIVPVSLSRGQSGDVAYLGPEQQGISFGSLREADGFWLFLKPGATLSVQGWKVTLAD